jgi:hypothetical protein
MPSSNDFNLICSDVTAMSYLSGSFVITDGESASPPPTFSHDSKTSTWTVNIAADRSGSTDVANSFNAKTGGSLHNYTNASGDKSPEKLNFYFGVVATFAVGGQSVPVTFYLGQGHYGTSNNWWLGGNNVLYSGGDPLFNVVSGSTILATYKISGSGSYTMTLTPA